MADRSTGDFGKLFAARKAVKSSDIQTSESLGVSSSKLSKSKDPDYQRTTVYLPKALHRRLKIAALEGDQEISAIVEELVEVWLSSQNSNT